MVSAACRREAEPRRQIFYLYALPERHSHSAQQGGAAAFRRTNQRRPLVNRPEDVNPTGTFVSLERPTTSKTWSALPRQAASVLESDHLGQARAKAVLPTSCRVSTSV
jgi:hypothetical protein